MLTKRYPFSKKPTTMKYHLLLLIVCSLFISRCMISTDEDKHAEYAPEENGKATLTLIIQPFEGFPASSANLIAKQLKEMYSGTIVVNDAIPFPDNAFNPARSRYRADSLIKYLSTLAKDDQLIIGLTNRDISTTKDNYPDWGIMGLGYCPGKSCIASTFRLKGGNQLEKLFKVAIHELGHTQGLPHCPNQTCLMRDAEGKDHLDEEKEFCPRCKAVLIKAGWNLK